jgi:photosystem II stability/assembly factor-like uncharacterized protein
MKKTIIILILILSSSALAEKEWVQKLFDEDDDFLTIQCLDSINCYAFSQSQGGGLTRVYKSTDQGDIWEKIYEFNHYDVDDSVSYVSRCFVEDSSDVYMTYGDRALLDKSTDGGITFRRITFGDVSKVEDNFTSEIIMYNKKIGILCAYDDVVYTSDGWETYKTSKKSECQSAGNPAYFIDSINVVFSLGIDWLYKFNLVDHSWTEYYKGLELDPEEPHRHINDAYFVNDTLGFGCGGQRTGIGDYNKNVIWKTTDKGEHWRIVNENEGPIKSFGLSSIAFTEDGKRGMATANWGVMLETNDYGETWEYIDPPEVNKKATTHRVAFSGQYPLVSSTAGGIMRQELVDKVEDYEDENIIIYQSLDELVIELIEKPVSKLSFQIVDLIGREIIKESYENQQKISIDLSQINSGFYMFKIVSDSRVLKTGKFTK